MKIIANSFVLLLLMACAATDEKDRSRRDTAIPDFIEVNELEAVDVIRTRDQLVSRDVNDTFIIVSTRKQDFLLEYHSRCLDDIDGHVKPDIRRDAGTLHAGMDTFRGCRIKAIYSLGQGQADELREIGKSIGR